MNITKDKEFMKIIKLFFIVKIVIISAGVFSQTIPDEITSRQERAGFLINAWAQYDAAAYVDIAENGYNKDFMGGRGNYAWYPLYPLLIRIFSFLGYWNAAFLISNAASLLAVAALYLLIREELNKAQTYRTLAYIMLFPTAYFFTAMYTESLFLLLSAASFYFAKREKWLSAGAAGFLLALTRPQGIIILFPLLYIYFKNNGFAAKRDIAYAFLPLLSVVFLLAYHYAATGNPFIQMSTQEDFKRSLSFPWVPVFNSISLLINTPGLAGKFYHILNLFTLAFFSAFLVKSYKMIGKEYFIYYLVSLMVPLFTQRLEAITRFYLVVFPAFMTMSISADNRGTGTALKALYFAFSILMIMFAIRHGNEDILLDAF